MTPSEWPLRFIPRRNPPLWQAALITVAGYAGSVAVRAAFADSGNPTALSSIYFPALILTTLFAGARWGWASLAATLLIGYFSTNTIAATVSRDAIMIQFGLAGAATVLVAAGLREALIRLDEAQAAEAEVKADLIATEGRFRMLADSAPVLMWLSKVDGSREFVNRAYLDFLGLAYEEAMAFDWRALIHPEDLERIAAEEAASVASGGDYIW